MAYEVQEWGYLSNEYAQRIHHDGGLARLLKVPGRGGVEPWTLKGCEYLWLLSKLGGIGPQTVADVGSQASALPQFVGEQFDCEAWAVDKYDEQRVFAKDRYNELVDRLGYDPRERYGRVKYVNAFMGEFTKDLPDSYFDVVYSLSVLEHVDFPNMPDVFRDMDRILKPGGYLIHAVDLSIPLGKSRVIAEKFQPGKSEKATQLLQLPMGRIAAKLLQWMATSRYTTVPMLMAEWLYHWGMCLTATRSAPYLFTAPGWRKFLKRELGLRDPAGMMKDTGVWEALASHDVFVESIRSRYEYWAPDNTPKSYWPVTALLFVLRKV